MPAFLVWLCGSLKLSTNEDVSRCYWRWVPQYRDVEISKAAEPFLALLGGVGTKLFFKDLRGRPPYCIKKFESLVDD
jgi:hypothetical protein